MIKRIDFKKMMMKEGDDQAWSQCYGLFPRYMELMKESRDLLSGLFPCPGPHDHYDEGLLCFYECSKHPFWNRPAEQVVATINDALERYG